jgi:hypothetical protein
LLFTSSLDTVYNQPIKPIAMHRQSHIRTPSRIGSAVCILLGTVSALAAQVSQGEADLQLANQFDGQVKPFIDAYCIDCHGADKPKAKFSLTPFQSLGDVIQGHLHWDHVIDKLKEGEMPPEEAKTFPNQEDITAVVNWYERVRRQESLKNAGDPGIVLARRLSNAEYNYSIRDLTGIDIRPTKTFPIDAANQAGFDNSGESLNLTPGLLNKYLQAARAVTEHLVLTPSGINWSTHPTVTETDRDKYAVLRIIDFYQRQPIDLADYFLAAWHHRSRAESQSIEMTASNEKVSEKYLHEIWDLLTSQAESIGPIGKIQNWWQALPDSDQEEDAVEACQSICDYIGTIRRQIEPHIENLEGGSIHKGSQTYVLWKNRRYAANRQRYDPEALMTQSQIDDRIEASKKAIEQAKENKARNRDSLKVFKQPHPDLVLPESPENHKLIHQSFAHFATLFPDAFFISERGRDYVGKARDQQEKGRLLSAGFHSMMGYYRDDQPLYDMILDEADQIEIDRLWNELDFISKAPKRQFIGFLWFERTDSRYMTDEAFDFARAEHEDATEESKIKQLAQVYLAKAERNGAKTTSLEAVEDYFERINHRIRWLETVEQESEASHLADLLLLAGNAYRRPLSQTEKDHLLEFYHSLRTNSDFSHEDAMRDAVTSVLVSPHFFYRIVASTPSPKEEVTPLSDLDLASRLSYFLWSSLPDSELLAEASKARLHEPETLARQTVRMLRDSRIRGLAVEFGANWLDFRRFQSHNAVDRERFVQFDDSLREAMFEEPIRYFIDLIQNDRPIRTLLYGTHTFANLPLAKHYGFPPQKFEDGEWHRFDQARDFNRGGILPMSVFLTMNAPGLRTSPVKRGYWVARRVLGEAIPPPPPDVPEIPSDEASLGDLTLPEILAKHREHPNCAACHDRFDSLGLVFENFGPIGERREFDFGNRPISTAATFPDGSSGTGIIGIKDYIRANRETEFYTNFCRKLLAFALNRTLLMSDDPLIERMLANLNKSDYRFSVAIESIVTSRQFLNRRVVQKLAHN